MQIRHANVYINRVDVEALREVERDVLLTWNLAATGILRQCSYNKFLLASRKPEEISKN